MNLKKYVWLVLLFLSFEALGQVREFDKLEMFYDQGHYRMVYRKANRLLDNPEYDYSQIPTFYKSLALFQMSQNEYWFKRHPESLDEAKELFMKIKSASDGIRVFEAHIFEVSALKRDLVAWSEDLKRTGKRQAFENVHEILYGLFDGVPDIEFEGGVAAEEISAESNDPKESEATHDQREKILALAMKQVGVPYVWSGNDPKGFDCSGFTSYVMRGVQKEVPRRARDQYDAAIKVKEKNVQKGDLVFFDNGGGISHVGIIVSDRGEPLKMIHASSTQGIVITDLDKSAYWQKRISGYGTFVEQ